MVDREAVRRHLSRLDVEVALLGRYAREHDVRSLARDVDAQHKVLHAVYLAVQSCIDLAGHLAAELPVSRPATYRGSFDALASAGVLDPDLAERLGDWAGLRNVIAHLYLEVDFERVHAAIANDLDDLRGFADTVRGRLA